MVPTTKPLPDVPHSPSEELTVDGREHLRRFIDLALSQESEALKIWAVALETALSELADALREGGWLSGIKQARACRKEKFSNRGSVPKLDPSGDAEKSEKAAEGQEASEGKAAGEETKKPGVEGPGDLTSGSSLFGDPEESEDTAPEPPKRRDIIALQQLRGLAGSGESLPSALPKHLLLTAALPNDHSPLHSPISSHSTRTCTFHSREFALPKPDLFGDDPSGNADLADKVSLYGFREWETDSSLRPDPVELVGGSFSFSPRPSSEEHETLMKILRAALFVFLSLLLEQSFLADANVELHFPKPEPRVRPLNRMRSLSRPAAVPAGSNTPDTKHRFRDSFLSTSILGVFSKKTSGISNRYPSLLPRTKPARASLDIPSPIATAPPPSPADDPTPVRQRRFSFFGEHHKTPSSQSDPPDEPLFQSVFRRLQSSNNILSTSPDVLLPPPPLLSRLVEKEKANPTQRLLGEERTALASVFGWESRKARGAGMTGIKGFLSQQRISVLYSEHIPLQPGRRASVASEVQVKSPDDQNTQSRVHCGPRMYLQTYDYYAFHQEKDRLLGDMIVHACDTAEDKCTVPKCPALRGQHELRWLHHGLRVVATVQKLDDGELGRDHIFAWESCTECDAASPRRPISDGTYLLSFAKFLELIFYSTRLVSPLRPLCPHTTPPPQPWIGKDSPIPQSRFHIVRQFAFNSHVLSFSLSRIENIFDLRLPRLQIARAPERVPSEASVQSPTASQKIESSDAKRTQQKEIRAWWQAIAEHLDKLETHFDEDPASYSRKALPRLPSEWDDGSDTPTTMTPRAGTSSLPSTSPSSPTLSSFSQESSPISVSALELPRSQSVPTDIHDTSMEAKSPEERMTHALALLSNMRFAFQRMEQELYKQLQDVPESELNNVRRIFHAAALGVLRRLAAWEAKHLAKEAKSELAAARQAIETPWWWGETYHAVPGSNIIIKDDDWGSIIAFTLSSSDYQQELGDMTHQRVMSSTSEYSPEHSPVSATFEISRGSPPASSASESSFQFFNKRSEKLRMDPDNDEVVWAEPETWSAVISRKEHPRDPTALLSLREVLRQRAPLDGVLGLPPSLMTGVSRIVGSGDRGSVYAKPETEISKEVADGQILESSDTINKLLHELDSVSVSSGTGGRSAPSETSGAGSALVTTNIERRKTASVISRDSFVSSGSRDSDETAAPEGTMTPRGSDRGTVTQANSPTSPNEDESGQRVPVPQASSFSWAGSISSMVRFMAKVGDSQTPTLSTAARPHDLLAAHAGHIDERPHVKYDWTIGARLKYSCTVYYAKQFDLLRKQCGVGDVFLSSMMRSANWSADGGKSKSNFWKTADDRFIIKTLVDAWNVADLQVLIELAPSYFRYMETTAHKASVIAKMLGFYTIEIRNLETNTVQSRADLLVMENLFYSQNISKIFDLKGIQGRKVKTTSPSESRTLFDGEWIEGQEKALTLVYPHSKVALHEGLKSDCEFLAKSNIMDYSLLLGINETDKQISCGLVDTIGSFTFAKTLEYKAKQGFSGKDGKEVTVMPPHEYQERFIKALDGYFLACPDKWTKPEDEKAVYEYMDLPSVL